MLSIFAFEPTFASDTKWCLHNGKAPTFIAFQIILCKISISLIFKYFVYLESILKSFYLYEKNVYDFKNANNYPILNQCQIWEIFLL